MSSTVNYAIYNESRIASLGIKRAYQAHSYLSENHTLCFRFKASTAHALKESLQSWKDGIDVLIMHTPFCLPESENLIYTVSRDYPELKILILTPDIRQSVHDQMYEAGATNIISSSDGFDELVKVCVKLKEKGIFVNESLREYHRNLNKRKNTETLVDIYKPSAEHIEVVKLINSGFSYTQTAEKLGFKETHVNHVLEKIRNTIGANNNSGVTKYFRIHHYISDDDDGF